MSTILDKANDILLDKETNLLPENLKQGVTCMGVTGELVPHLDLQSKSVTPNATGFDVEPDSNFDGLSRVIVSGDADLIPTNIKHNVTIFGVTGTVPTKDETLDEYFDKSLTNSKYKFDDIVKKNPPLNTSSLTTMQDMFAESGLREIDTTGYSSSGVRNMAGFCRDCVHLTKFDGSGLNTANVTDMSEMFKGCSNLTDTNFYAFRVTSVTDMSEMFSGCSSLASLNLSVFVTSALVNAEKMFYNCTNLTNLNLKGFKYSNITNSTDMFTGIPSDCKIVVVDQATKDWILSVRSDLSNIQVSKEIFIVNSSEYGKIGYSFDGITWNSVSLYSGYYGVVSSGSASNGSVIVVLTCGGITGHIQYANYSTDGVNWNKFSSNFGTSDATDIAYGNGKFVTWTTDGYSWTSTDGITFTKATNKISDVDITSGKILFNGSIFMMVLTNGYIFTSTNGTSWTQRGSRLWNTSLTPWSLIWDGSHFIFCNNYDLYVTSDNGNNWSITSVTTLGFSPVSLGYHDGLYVADSTNGTYYSTDLIHWTKGAEYDRNKGYSVGNIAYGDGKFVMVQCTDSYATYPRYSFSGTGDWLGGSGLSINERYKRYSDVRFHEL